MPVASIIANSSCVPQSATKQLNTSDYEDRSVDICGIIGQEEKLETSAMSSVQQNGSQLLLQQLMSRDQIQSSALTEARDATGSRTTRNDGADFSPIIELTDTAAQILEDKKKSICNSDGRENGSIDSGTRARRQSNSVLMNLLVSGCDVSAGYVCLAKPKSISIPSK